jgi:Flp pilus assembly protein TadG
MTTMSRRLRADESGAETLEFAFAAPVLLLLVFGLIYGIVTAAAYVSLSHAASVGARYAAIPSDPIHSVYPADDQVLDKIDSRTPFFTADDCTLLVTGEQRDNAPVELAVACSFPNPLGRMVNGLGAIVSGDKPSDVGPGPHPEGDLTLSVSARGRRE